MPTTVHSDHYDLLTRDEAAAVLRLRPKTLSAWALRGSGPRFIKMGRSVRYRRRDLELFMRESEVGSWVSTRKAGDDRHSD